MDATSLPKVKMPNRDGFVADPDRISERNGAGTERASQRRRVKPP